MDEIYDARAAHDKYVRQPRKPQNIIRQFTKWKQEAIDMMLQNDTLMKLLYYNTEDWHSKPNLTDDQKYSMVNKQIMQFKVNQEIIEEKKSYVSMNFNHIKPQEGFRQFSTDFMQGYFYFNVLVDAGIIITDLGCRTDLIAAEIIDLFEGTKVFGAGKATCETALDTWADNNSHGGYTIGFLISDLK